MQHKRNDNSRVTAFSVSLLVIAVLLAMAVASFCWYAKIFKVQARGMSVKTDEYVPLSVSDIMILKRDGIAGATDVSRQESIVMSEFDSVFPDKNVNTPIVVRATLLITDMEGFNDNPITVTVNCDTGTDADAWLTSVTDKVTGNKKDVFGEVLSNIIEFRFSVVNENMVEGLVPITDKDGNPTGKYTDESIYTSALDLLKREQYLLGTDKVNTFVYEITKAEYDAKLAQKKQVTKADVMVGSSTVTKYYAKRSTIELEIPKDFIDTYAIVDPSGTYRTLICYIEINYNDALVASYTAQHGIDVSSGSSSETSLFGAIPFDSDLHEFNFQREVYVQ